MSAAIDVVIRETLAGVFGAAQQRGELRADHDAGELASIFAYLWFHSCTRWLHDPERFALEPSLRMAADVFLNGSYARNEVANYVAPSRLDA